MRYWHLLAFFVAATTLLADGGKLLLRREAGPLRVSVFHSEEQVRAGRSDFTVMVQEKATGSALENASVNLDFTQVTANGISEVFAPATHAKATDKLLYGAQVDLPATGPWRMVVKVSSSVGTAEIAESVSVSPPQAPVAKYWPYFAIVPVLIALYLLNQLLRKRQRTNRLSVQP